MKFSVAQDSLNQALTIVTKAIVNNSTLPLLNGVLIKATEDALLFETTNLDVSIHHKIPALIEDPGTIVVPGKVFQTIVKNLPDAAIEIKLEGSILSIDCGQSHYTLNTLAAADFPSFPEVDMEQSVELPSTLLFSMVNKVHKAASSDKNRAVLTGILMTVENNMINLVATDSYRLAIAETSVETSSVDNRFEVIIPSTVLFEALQLASSFDKLTIGITGSQIIATFGETVYVSRRIEGNFPNYKQLLPKSHNTLLKLDLNDFAASMRRVSVMTQNTSSVRFSVNAEENNLILTSNLPDQGGAQEKINSEVEGDSMDIAFNYHYVIDCINACKGEKGEINLELQSSLKPGIFKTYGNINFLYLVMPVRI